MWVGAWPARRVEVPVGSHWWVTDYLLPYQLELPESNPQAPSLLSLDKDTLCVELVISVMRLWPCILKARDWPKVVHQAEENKISCIQEGEVNLIPVTRLQEKSINPRCLFSLVTKMICKILSPSWNHKVSYSFMASHVQEGQFLLPEGLQ